MSIESIFLPLTEENQAQLDRFGSVLARTFPLRGKHLEALPHAIREMSRNLTTERVEVHTNYMGDARYLSAYLNYFLPWNLYRLSRLFTGLALDVPDGGTIVDLGTGPLTAIMALWICRPELRDRKLNITCVDRTPKPMASGLKLFQELAGKDSPWRIKTVKANITDKLLHKADLLIAANTYNELNWTGRNAEEQAIRIATGLARSLTPEGRLVIVETGVRITGKIISTLREQLMLQGLFPAAPCTHSGPCPMPGAGRNAWCHFNFNVAGSPEWLREISAKAGLAKKSVSLNFVYMARTEPETWGMVRAVSEPFPIPEGTGQYGCAERGMVLISLPDKHRFLFPGQAFHPNWPPNPGRDKKTGAPILPLAPPKG